MSASIAFNSHVLPLAPTSDEREIDELRVGFAERRASPTAPLETALSSAYSLHLDES